jgi:phage-related protein
MYHGIDWTTHTDVGRGLRAVTNDANVIASALRNGAGAADATIRSVLQTVGNGAANLNNAINSVSNAVNSAGNSINNFITSLSTRPW